MKNGFRVLDSDIHTMEPAGLYLKHMDGRWGDRIPRAQGPRPETGIYTYVTAAGKPVRTPPPEMRGRRPAYRGISDDPRVVPLQFQEACARDFVPPSMLQAMETEGVDIAVMFRTYPLISDETLEPEYAIALAQAWNNWAAEYASADRQRLKVAAILPLHDPQLAAREARRAVSTLGAAALCIQPEPINGKVVHDPAFDPIWAEAQDLDVPVCIHPTGAPNQPSVGNRFLPYTPPALWGAMTQPLENQLALASFCSGGILERFPRLRVAFLEGNCSWLPWLLYRLDDRRKGKGRYETAIKLSLMPSEYFRRQCFCSMDVDEEPAAEVVRQLGDDCLLFSTDWPHSDAAYPHATETFLALEGLTGMSRRKILWDNAARLYNLR